jgi:uncharacterized protein (TIGR00251 family)
MPEPQPQSITLAVRVTPRARRNAVVKTDDKSLKVYVTAPPEDGRANEAVVEVIAKWLGVKRRQVEIISGATSRQKLVRITGATLPRDTP